MTCKRHLWMSPFAQLWFCMPTDQSATRMSYSLLAFDRYLLSWLAGWYLSEVHTVAPSFPCQGLPGAEDVVLGDTW